MKKFFKRNRFAASIALVLTVVLTVLLGVNLSVWRLYSRVEKCYFDGRGDSAPVIATLKKCIPLAENIAGAAEGCSIPSADLSDAIEKLSAGSETLPSSNELSEKLFGKALSVCNQILASGSAADGQLKLAYNSLESLNNMIGQLADNAEYNAAAAKYNAAAASSAAKLLTPRRGSAAVFSHLKEMYGEAYEEPIKAYKAYDDSSMIPEDPYAPGIGENEAEVRHSGGFFKDIIKLNIFAGIIAILVFIGLIIAALSTAAALIASVSKKFSSAVGSAVRKATAGGKRFGFDFSTSAPPKSQRFEHVTRYASSYNKPGGAKPSGGGHGGGKGGHGGRKN